MTTLRPIERARAAMCRPRWAVPQRMSPTGRNPKFKLRHSRSLAPSRLAAALLSLNGAVGRPASKATKL